MISSAASSRSHSSWITAAISRSTPRVRWNFSSVDQSLEELVEQLRMDRVRRTRAAAGSRPPARRAGTRPRASGRGRRSALTTASRSRCELGRHVLEQPAADDLEPLLGRRRLPRGLLAEDDVREPRRAPPCPPRRRPRCPTPGSRRRASRSFTRFAASESACAKVICVSNVPAGKVVAPVQLSRVGDPLVDQDQARRVALRAACQRVARDSCRASSALATSA